MTGPVSAGVWMLAKVVQEFAHFGFVLRTDNEIFTAWHVPILLGSKCVVFSTRAMLYGYHDAQQRASTIHH